MLMKYIPVFKGADFFPHDLRLPFMSYKGVALAASVVAMLLSLALCMTRGLNYGVDFKGGSLIELQAKSGNADVGALRDKLNALGLGNVQIQEFGNASDVLIRMEEQPGGEAAQQPAVKKVTDATEADYTQRRVEVVGPAVSSELRMTGFIAVGAGILAIVCYVWFRFEWQFALGAIVSLVHDVMFTIGIFALFHLDFDLTIVAALLTILGYSINDTVVIYDRIRENLRRYKRMPLGELLDLSVNETMSRTIMTVGTVIMALVALYVFGGEVIRGFTFAMLFGVVVGTYSSVFIAAPFLIMIGVKRDWSGVEKAKVADKAVAKARAGRPASEPRPANVPFRDLSSDETEFETAEAVGSPLREASSGNAGTFSDQSMKAAGAGQPRRSPNAPKGKGKHRHGGRSKRRG